MTDIYTALAAVMEDCKSVAKRDRNTHQNFMFRGIDAVVNAVGPILRTHKVIVAPNVERVEYEEVHTSGGKASTACRVLVTYTFYAADGTSLDCRVAAEAWDAGDKAAPKAMSVAFRTALLQTLALPTDEVDPDAQSYERDRRAERVRGIDQNDPWATPAVGPGPRPSSEAARTLLRNLFTQAGIPAENRPVFIEDLIGHPVKAMTELTEPEIDKVIGRLRETLEATAARSPEPSPKPPAKKAAAKKAAPKPDCPEEGCDWRNPYRGATDGSADAAAADHGAWHQVQAEKAAGS